MRWAPRGYGGQRRSPEEVKREGWREQHPRLAEWLKAFEAATPAFDKTRPTG